MFGTRTHVLITKTLRDNVNTVVRCLERQLGSEGDRWMCYPDRNYTDALIIEFRDEKYLTLFQMSIDPSIPFYNDVDDLREEEAAKRRIDIDQMKSRLLREKEEFIQSMTYEEFLKGKF